MNMDIKNWNLEDSCDDTQFYYECVNNNDMIACIVMPHKDNNYNYILRVGFKSTFNKWGDVEFEEKFKTFLQLCECMENIKNFEDYKNLENDDE